MLRTCNVACRRDGHCTWLADRVLGGRSWVGVRLVSVGENQLAATVLMHTSHYNQF